jgi:acyl-CoA synthetase (AMP-forming)/AMP-acid ligase II
VYKPTVLFGPPAEFIELINYCRESHQQCPSFIRKIFLGSAPVLSGFLQKLVTYTHGSTEITCLYGMTEVLPIAVVDGRYKAAWKGEGDLLGQWVKGITPQILKDGELEVQSPHMFYKYLGQEKSQWVSTGDLVKIQKKELILMGRKKDMIIKGNYNIYPELYESTIQKIPGVAACAMVGIQDITLQDEKIILVVEPETQSDINIKKRIQDALRSGPYSIDSHAYPDDILIMKIPRSGRQLKINKKTLRALLIDKI